MEHPWFVGVIHGVRNASQLTSADFMSTQKRYNGYAGSGIVFNDQGQQKVSPIFKIVGSYI